MVDAHDSCGIVGHQSRLVIRTYFSLARKFVRNFRDNSPFMEPVCRLIRRVLRPSKRFWMHLGFNGIADFTVCGQTVRMWHTGAQVENSLFWAGYGGDYEGTTLLLWEQLAREAQVIFDVGANSGLFALAAKSAAPSAKVYAFEPLPLMADLLAKNVKLNNSSIFVHRAAVSDCNGSAVIRTSLNAHDYSASLGHMDWMDEGSFEEIKVPCVRLDHVIAQSGDWPDLMKIDIERHEVAALRGLWSGNENSVAPAIVIELLDEEVAVGVAKQFEGRGYTSFSIREGCEIRKEPIWTTPVSGNWLMLPPNSKGWAKALIDAGGATHGELTAKRPSRPGNPTRGAGSLT